ncbi:MAG: hypothetical protein Q7S92_00765 [Candidatus Diapherotrites archaeon]|nr:hypothetical protein [Candidatus Diapherotrites archaeon]
MKFMHSEKAQVSLELIVLLAAVIAMVLLIVTRLQSTGNQAADQFDKKMDSVFKQIEKI